jgi:hypothetical protein
MKKVIWTFWLAGTVALPQVGAQPAAPPPAGETGSVSGPQTRPAAEAPLLEGELIGGEPAPVIPPAVVEEVSPRGRVVRLSEGTKIFDRLAALQKDPGGKWWTIPDARAGRLRLLPCRLLEAVETAQAENRQAEFRLSGEVYHYHDDYYLMLRQAAVVGPGEKPKLVPAPAPEKTTPPEPKPPTATAPTDEGASPEDVARRLLEGEPGTPVVPVARPEGRGDVGTPVAPPGEPIQAGPGDMVINRLTRLVPETADWFLIVFESDNTLREPPMRVLPSRHLEKIESWSGKGSAYGAVFHVSGEVHRYKGVDYLLLRNVLRKREMGQF